MKVAFTGGGTGGHIYPALALAQALHNACPELDAFYIGSNAKMDRAIVNSAGLRFYGVPAGKLRRYFSLKNFLDAFKVVAGILCARRVLKKERPMLVFSKGGFVSVPAVFAAASLGIPVWTHESDVSPGLATKLNSRFAQKIFTTYEKTGAFFPPDIRNKVVVSGQPVRAAFRGADAAAGRAFVGCPQGVDMLVVLGGSQGAKEINDAVAGALDELVKDFFVVHQTGGSGEGVRAARYFAVPSINEEMPAVLAAATLVVGRAGAGTVWEAATVGVPMVLLPLYGGATRGDQVENADYFAKHGAAVVLLHPTPQQLTTELHLLAHNKKRLASMANASRVIGKQDASAIICKAFKEELFYAYIDS
jgi:UDP-N-acetylglucosamine--N-acetylmuramyl-(pentapeptide) pyrophosphoryl-undecaprenol N-acetylglucosamine transferase